MFKAIDTCWYTIHTMCVQNHWCIVQKELHARVYAVDKDVEAFYTWYTFTRGIRRSYILQWEMLWYKKTLATRSGLGGLYAWKSESNLLTPCDEEEELIFSCILKQTYTNCSLDKKASEHGKCSLWGRTSSQVWHKICKSTLWHPQYPSSTSKFIRLFHVTKG